MNVFYSQWRREGSSATGLLHKLLSCVHKSHDEMYLFVLTCTHLWNQTVTEETQMFPLTTKIFVAPQWEWENSMQAVCDLQRAHLTLCTMGVILMLP